VIANPIVVPAHAHPIVWVVALVAIWAEVRVEMAVLRRFGRTAPQLFAPLFALNLTTWFVFLIAVDAVDRAKWPMPGSIIALELAVVLIDAVLIHSAMHGRLFTRGLRLTPISGENALGVSFVGNLVSVAISLLVPLFAFVL
jgi:hypothetical protein